MQVGAVRNRIADIDPDAKADGPIGRVANIMVGNLLLHLDRAAHGSIDAVEHDQQRVASGLNQSAACSAIAGSITWLRSARSRSSVPLSSSPISRL